MLKCFTQQLPSHVPFLCDSPTPMTVVITFIQVISDPFHACFGTVEKNLQAHYWVNLFFLPPKSIIQAV